ncbi:MAG: protein kinase domain-containing protein [Gemmatimonadota bacterium]
MAATGTEPGGAATYQPRGGGLTRRVFFAVAGVVAIVLLLTLVLFTSASSGAATTLAERAFARTSTVVSELLRGRERALINGARVFALNPVFRSLVADTGRADLFDQSIEASDRIGASWVQITDGAGIRLARSDDPTAQPADVSGSALIAGALRNEQTSGFGASGDTALFQAIAVPITHDSARVIGTLMGALVMDSVLAAEVRDATDSEIVFFVRSISGVARVAVSTLGPPINRVLQAHLDSERAAVAGPVAIDAGGTTYVARTSPLVTAGGDTLGGILALRSRATELAPFATLRRQIVSAGAVGLALAVGLSLLAARFITKPLLLLIAATRRGAEGDYSTIVDVRSSDEIGTLAAAVRTMLADLREKEALASLLRDETPRHDTSARHGGHSAWGAGNVVAGRYEIRETLGAGGAGVVYRALDRDLDEVVAIKTVLPEILGDDATALDRLKSEIRLARRISHRNVVRIHDFGDAGGVHFITMECVSGTSVRELIARYGRLPVEAVIGLGKQLCRGLEAAHEQGIIHRDIKPQNLMLQPDGTLKIMDFGVARLQQRTSQLTQVGLVVGTPDYMAPEQLLDEPIDARADLYSAGVVLYECLAGKRPFDADTAVTLIGLKLSAAPRPLTDFRDDVPPRLTGLIMQLLARTAAERPESANRLHDLLLAAEG